MNRHLSAANQYRPDAIWNARRAFFDEGLAPQGLVHESVFRSWLRCSENGRCADEPVEFQSVDRSHLSQLLAANMDLLDAARPELADLASAVGDAGYAVLLTDRAGNALAVDGAIAQRSAPLRMAFRAGVNLSESAIGTSAMAVALRDGRTARVLGPEHFYTENQIFHCSASPVFDPVGEVIGSVDVSRDMPGLVESTGWLAARCAQRIERRLFLRLPAQVHLEIDAGGDGGLSHSSGAWLAFGDAGELLAANRSARRLLGIAPGDLPPEDFEMIFGQRFGAWISTLRRSGATAPLRLLNGLRLRAMAMDAPLQHSLSRRAPPSPTTVAAPLLGDSKLARAFERTLRVMNAGLSVLVTGETGTGKEVVARALHAASNRSSGPLIALNCAALPQELLAGELFGHVEGAFTGSRRGGAIGKVEAADGGTLFLDEIGDMPIALQATLLRVLDSGEVVRLGCTRARPVDLRIVCATHRDLPNLVRQGLFREDLLFRVAGHTLHLTPLRERDEFDAILDALLTRLGAAPDRIDEPLRAKLRSHQWRGNVRELTHALKRAISLTEDDGPLRETDFEMVRDGHTAAPTSGLLEEVTSLAIEKALVDAGGSVSRAAQHLGIGRATLYRRIKRNRS